MAATWEIKNLHAQIRIEHYPHKDFFYIKWCGHINSEDTIAVAKKYLELQQSFHCPKILNDKSDVTGDWAEANDWLEYEWLPLAVAAGLRYFSMVVSRDLHDLAPAQDLQKRFSPDCEVKLFRDLTQAKEWLESV